MIDVMPVPQWREDGVGKSEDQDVLRGFLSKEMVNAERLLFCEGIADNAIQFPRRVEIGAERFFDYDPCPASFAGLVQTCGFQVFKDRFELLGTGRKVEEAIAARAVGLVDLIKTFDQLLITSFTTKLAAVIKD